MNIHAYVYIYIYTCIYMSVHMHTEPGHRSLVERGRRKDFVRNKGPAYTFFFSILGFEDPT